MTTTTVTTSTTTSFTESSGDELIVGPGGAVAEPTISAGGALLVSGGAESGATVLLGGVEIVSTGSASGDLIYGDLDLAGGVVSNETVASGGLMSGTGVLLGSASDLGEVDGLTLGSYNDPGYLTVSSGGVASGVTGGYADLTVEAGGVVSGVSLYFGPGYTDSDQVYGSAVATQVQSRVAEDVDSGGVSLDAVVSDGGREVVSSGGVASGVTVLSGGTLVLEDGATAVGGTVSSGGVLVFSGVVGAGETFVDPGVAASTTTFAGVTILSGGQVEDPNAEVDSGGVLTLSAGAVVGNSAGGLTVSSGGVVNGAGVLLGSASDLGEIDGLTLGSYNDPGYLTVSSGGVASGVTGGYADLTVEAGGVVSGVSLYFGPGYTDSDQVYGSAVATQVQSRVAEDVDSGGVSIDAVVSSGGREVVSSGGVASGVTVLSGGTLVLGDGATAVGGTVSSGGVLVFSGVVGAGETFVDPGVAASTTTFAGVTILSGGQVEDPNAEVDSGGVLTLSAGAVVGNSAGGLTVSSGGVVNGAGVLLGSASDLGEIDGLTLGSYNDPGYLTVSSGGVASGVTGGYADLTVEAGGVVSGVSLYFGPGYTDSDRVYGSAVATQVQSRVAEVVDSGGVSLDAVVSDGGREVVSSGGVASGASVLAGGTLSGDGAIAGVTIVSSGAAEYGVTVLSGATDIVYGGATVSGVTVASGGTLDLQSPVVSGGTVLPDGVVGATEVVSGVTLVSGAVLGPLPGTAPPAIGAPASASVAQGSATTVSGIVLAETGAISSETFTVTVADATGILAAAGAGVTGDGTTSLTIAGSLGQVNADLAGLTVTEAGTGSDTLELSATDSFGHSGALATTALSVVPAGPLPPVWEELTGPGVMSGSGLAYALNLGTFDLDSGSVVAHLGLLNPVQNAMDALSGTFTTSGSSAFANTGLVAVPDLAAGQADTAPVVTFSTANVGAFTETITFDPVDTAGSGPATPEAPVTLTVTGTVVAPMAVAWGDVHIIDYDGLSYNFQAAGEFTLVKSTLAGDSFDVQIRLQPYYSSATVSVITAAACSVGTDRVTFDATRSDVVWVDGVASAIGAGDPTIALNGGVLKFVSSSQWEVMWNTGETMLVSDSGSYLNITTTLGSKDTSGSVEGLAGADDGQANDFQLADGTVLTQPLSSTTLLGAFADAWRVTQATSLLDYGPGQTTATFTDPNFPGDGVALASLPATVTQTAAAAVTAAGVTDPTIAADAELDYLSTGDPTFLSAAQTVAGETAAPTAATVSPSGATTPAALGVSAAASQIASDAGPATFEVYLTAAASSATTVTWSVIDPDADDLGPGAFGGAAPSGELSIAAGQTSGAFSVTLPAGVLGDAPTGVLEVEIAGPSGTPILAPTAQTTVVSSQALAGPPAEPALSQLSGPGTLAESGDSYTLNLGTLIAGDAVAPIVLAISNEATAPADTLGGTFALSAGAGFTVSGDGPLSPLAPGASDTGLSITADTGALGAQSQTLTFSPIDENASGYAAALTPITLTIEDTVVAAPTITGTTADQATTAEAPVTPFAGVTVGDANGGATDTLTITVGGTGGTLTGTGLTAQAAGVYTLAGAASAVTSELDALSFAATRGQPNTRSTTTFTLSDLSSADPTPTVDSATSVIDSDPGLALSIAAPADATAVQGVTTPIAGLAIAETGALAGETFTVTAADATGLLAATGAGVTGAGSASLTITGSLAQVNAALASLTVTEASAGSDTLSLTASDSFGDAAPTAAIALATAAAHQVSAPTSVAVRGSVAGAVTGVSLSDSVTSGTFTATVTDTSGTLSATGAGVKGSNSRTLTISGSLTQVNADLATLKVREGASVTTDTIAVTAKGPSGAALTPASVAVTVNGRPTITIATPTLEAVQGVASAVPGVSLAESGYTAGESFTATLTDGAGLLAATASGAASVSGEGSNSLTIAGSLADVNATLASLTDTEGQTTSDIVHVSAVDSLGGTSPTPKVTLDIAETFDLTAGADAFIGGVEPDAFVATSGALSSGDVLKGGSIANVLELQGAGTFDLTQPTTIARIQTIDAQEIQPASGVSASAGTQTVDLRAGMNGVTVDVAPATLNSADSNPASITIVGAANNDVIDLASGNDTVVVGAAQEKVEGGSGVDTIEVTRSTIGATIDGGSSGASTLQVSGGGTITMGSQISDIAAVDLEPATSAYRFTANAISGLVVDDLDTTRIDVIAAGAAGQTLTGGGSGKAVFIGFASGETVFEDAAAVFAGDTISAFTSSDLLQFDGLVATGSGVAVSYASTGTNKGVLSVSDNGTLVARLTLLGQAAATMFSAEADPTGTVIVDSTASSAQLHRLLTTNG